MAAPRGPLTWAAFAAAVAAPAPLPADWPPALRGLAAALRGDWDAAHDAVQPDDPACAWVHAALHHAEGDLGNADYWYGLAGQRRPAQAGAAEYTAIARALLGAAAG